MAQTRHLRKHSESMQPPEAPRFSPYHCEAPRARWGAKARRSGSSGRLACTSPPSRQRLLMQVPFGQLAEHAVFRAKDIGNKEKEAKDQYDTGTSWQIGHRRDRQPQSGSNCTEKTAGPKEDWKRIHKQIDRRRRHGARKSTAAPKSQSKHISAGAPERLGLPQPRARKASVKTAFEAGREQEVIRSSLRRSGLDRRR